MKLGCGVIGVGTRGRHSWERVLSRHPQVEVIAVSPDPEATPEMLEGLDEARARAYARELGAVYLPDYRDLLSREDIQIVSLMVEPRRAPVIGLEVAAAGKHVVTDKPIALQADQAVEWAESCRRSGVKSLVTYTYRYSPTVQRARAALAAGELGELLVANASLLFHNGPLAGFTATAGYRRAVGGGELTNFGSYIIDVLNWLSPQPVRRVYAELGNYFYPDYKAAGIEDFGCLLFEFANGAKGQLTTGRTQTPEAPPDFSLDFTGTLGSLMVRGDDLPVRVQAPGTGGVVRTDTTAGDRMVEAFVEAILTGGESPIPLEAGLAVQRVLDAAYASARLGRWEEVGVGRA